MRGKRTTSQARHRGVKPVDTDFQAGNEIGNSGTPRVMQVQTDRIVGIAVANRAHQALHLKRVAPSHGVIQRDLADLHAQVLRPCFLVTEQAHHALGADGALVVASEGHGHADIEFLESQFAKLRHVARHLIELLRHAAIGVLLAEGFARIQ